MSRVADAVGQAVPVTAIPAIAPAIAPAVTPAPARAAQRGHARAAHPTRTARAVPPTRLAQTSRPANEANEAMDRFAAGDDAAFAEVYAAVLPHLVRALGRLTRQRAAAEDLAQEATLRIYGARATWRPGSRVLPWAQAIARRLFIDRVRRHRREQRAHDVLAHDEPAWSGARADVHLDTRRKAAALAAMVERLPPRQREVLQLVCLDGKSLAEASAELGESNVAVRVRVHRARCALEAALAGH